MSTQHKDFSDFKKEAEQLKHALDNKPKLIETISSLTLLQQVSLEGYFKGYTSNEIGYKVEQPTELIEESYREAVNILAKVGVLHDFQCLQINNISLG